MPRENSFSDSEGRSLTPDLDEETSIHINSPGYSSPPVHQPFSDGASKVHTVRSQQTTRSRPGISVTPKDRFRNSVKRVIQLQRGTSTLFGPRGAGAEPGVDPRRESAYLTWGHVRQNCVIEVADYNSVRVSFGKMTNREFINFLDNPDASQREPWAKVRWINIGGISWDVISALALKYNIHPLAVEDTLHHRDTRSKADYYSKHLFLRVACHQLDRKTSNNGNATAAMGSTLTDAPRSSSPVSFDDVLDDDEDTALPEYEGLPRRGSTIRWFTPTKKDTADIERPHDNQKSASLVSRWAQQQYRSTRQKREKAAVIEKLKDDDARVKVSLDTMYIFLFRDGTVITMFPQADLDFTAPVTARVRQNDTSLRTTSDASLLVQGILDLIVDRAMEVIEKYHGRIQEFESQILMKTNVKAVRKLHILSGELILHKRSLEPIKQVIYGLRRYDLDRCVALVDAASDPDAVKKVTGFMSHKSKIYLADVYDHMEYILSSLDMYSSITENLIDYTFNMASYEMNMVMRRLTLVTVICLPLTLLVGYFGMNFDPFWAVQQNSDVLFWIIALPVMAVLIPLFMWQDITNGYHYAVKQMGVKRVRRSFKQD